MNVAGIILAAGSSTRFQDGHKLLVKIDGVAIVRRVALALAASSLGDIVLVTPANNPAVAEKAGSGRWRTVENPAPEAGLSSSLRVGLQNIAAAADGALIALADMPGFRTELIDALLAAFDESGGRSMVFPIASDGRRGHPVVWPRALFPALRALTGDAGGKTIFDAHRDMWQGVSTEDAGAFADIDTREDLESYNRGGV